MIRGMVNNRNEAVVPLRVRGQLGSELQIDAVVDSGFTSTLTLPMSAVKELGLSQESGGIARLADGTAREYRMYAAEVEWDGRWKPVLVSVIGNYTLLGMRLLAGHKLGIEVVPDGAVEIVKIT